jgi:DNA-binding MarR family transcriptional regulator
MIDKKDKSLKRIIYLFPQLKDDLHQTMFGENEKKLGFSKLQAQTILSLLHHDSTKMSILQKELNTTPSTMTSIINTLEKRKLVSRTHSMEDKRVINVELTKEGLKLGLQLREETNKTFVQQLTKLSKEEEKLFWSSVDTLETLIEKIGNK